MLYEVITEFSSWLLEGCYKTAGTAEGGVGAVQRYYDQQRFDTIAALGNTDIFTPHLDFV